MATVPASKTAALVFVAWKEAWLVQVACDGGLKSSECRVAVLIGKHLNRKTLEAFPGQQGMSLALGCHVDTVKRAVTSMVERGHLESYRKGYGNKNLIHYRPILKGHSSPQPRGDDERNDLLNDGADQGGVKPASTQQPCAPYPRAPAPGIPAPTHRGIPASAPPITLEENLRREPIEEEPFAGECPNHQIASSSTWSPPSSPSSCHPGNWETDPGRPPADTAAPTPARAKDLDDFFGI